VGVPTLSFTLTATVPASPEQAIDFLMRLDGHRGMHPYLQSAVVVAEGEDHGAPWWDWNIVERPAVGPFRYTIRFPARMTRLGPDRMRGHVRAARGCLLDSVTSAADAQEGSVVTETTEVTAPAAVLGYMTRHARLAHERTFALLPVELAS